MCVTESLCSTAEINTTLSIKYTSIKKKIHEQQNYAKSSKVLINKLNKKRFEKYKNKDH